MIKIRILKKDDIIVGFKCEGHSGYAEEGSDIVCSAISALTQTACLGIVEILKIKAMIRQDENKPSLEIHLPNGLSAALLDKTQVVFKTMLSGIENTRREYKKFIKLEESYEV